MSPRSEKCSQIFTFIFPELGHMIRKCPVISIRLIIASCANSSATRRSPSAP
ncbi:hypothetical protein Salmuc_00477 [Salipiger mucosus DSM 16094]|uniref:Uncharacterized protein n=1 Tax=Salipiger mucosus DSM 16094 TaxID=1123237 RepID=S9REV9_9RHOB|nr:hypothetical protein Salmuc_00477 [Salipiger mucosus DSM 16094]